MDAKIVADVSAAVVVGGFAETASLEKTERSEKEEEEEEARQQQHSTFSRGACYLVRPFPRVARPSPIIVPRERTRAQSACIKPGGRIVHDIRSIVTQRVIPVMPRARGLRA